MLLRENSTVMVVVEENTFAFACRHQEELQDGCKGQRLFYYSSKMRPPVLLV
jgi:hypothetical protein